MRKYLVRLVFVLVAITFIQCAGGSDEGVDWSKYSPEVRQRIDNSSDCKVLQNEFDTASANSDRQRARTGEGNLKLMDYIDKKMQKLGCY